MKRAAAVLAAPVLLLGPAAMAWTTARTASATVGSATLGAPAGAHCTSSLGLATPISIAWSAPAALAGKPTGPLSYTVRRQADGGAWTTIASGVTAATLSDDPSTLFALGTVWSYQVRAVYGSWTGAWSTSVSGVYSSVLFITVLSTCSP